MNRVKELCIRKGIEQKELSLLVGVSQPTVSDWFNQKKNPSGARLEKLSEILGVNRAVILGYSEDVAKDVGRSVSYAESKSAIQLYNAAEDRGQSLIERLRGLSPERLKQAMDYITFLEQQDD